MARTGAEYLDSLRDGRTVQYDGQVIADIATHPHFAGGARTIAGLIDLESNPAVRGVLLRPGEDGTPMPWIYSNAASREDVRQRSIAHQTIARHTGGLLGRSPDFIAAIVTAWAAAANAFGTSADAIRRYHAMCATKRLCHAHAIVDPPGARRTGGADESTRLRIVDAGDAGIRVSGMKMMATLAPFADELLVYPWGRPLRPEESEHAVAFAVPTATPGLTMLCRPGHAGGHPADRPLANRYDEMDALCVFDQVFVPWERVFIFRDVELANGLPQVTSMLPHLYHQVAVRAAVKAEFCLGVALLAADAADKRNDPALAEPLGAAAADVRALRALVRAAEEGAERDKHGWWVADLDYLQAAPAINLRLYPRLVDVVRTVTASSVVLAPTSGDETGPYADLYRRYFETPAHSAGDHLALLRLAADLVASGFGARQDLFERYYLGPPARVLGNVLRGYDDQPGRSMVEALLHAA